MNSGFIHSLTWFVFAFLVGWISFPIAFSLFKKLPDRGYTITKSLGILLVSFFHWFLTSLGLSQNSVGGIWLAIILVIILACQAIWQVKGRVLLNWVKQNWRLIIVSEIIFLLAFVSLAWLRTYNPNIYGTEKPMELMFINSVLQSPSFPPQDAWLSGFSISYYYFGYVMVALISMITNTPAGIAFNLGISLTFALAFSGAFGILLNLITRGAGRMDGQKVNIIRHVPSALIAPLILLVVGNFYGILEVLHNHHILAETKIPAIWFQSGYIEPDTQVVQAPQIRSGTIDFWEWLDIKQLGPIPKKDLSFKRIEQNNWFFASRTIHDRNLMGYDPEAIDEFPAFSFLLADLHPHVLALPFVLLVILLSYEWFLGMKEPPGESGESETDIIKITLSAIMLGSLIFINTWDFPIYLFLFLLAGGMAYVSRENWSWNWRNLISFFFPQILTIVLAILLYLPFILSLQSQAGGLIPNAIYPTKLRQLLVMFGPLIFGVLALMLAVQKKFKKALDHRAGLKAATGFLVVMIILTALLIMVMLINPETASIVQGAVSPLPLGEALRWILLRRAVEGGSLLLGFVIMAGSIAILWGLRKSESNELLFTSMLLLTGVLLLLGPEFVYLRDNFGWRMNTLFKFYFQIWVLWSIVSAFGVWFIKTQLRGWLSHLLIFIIWAGILTGLVYTAGTLQVTTAFMRAQTKNESQITPTLDGLAYYKRDHPEDWTMIEWINHEIKTPAVILEGTKGAYWVDGGSSRISMMSGIPTVMGWVNHEAQWRGENFEQVAMREGDIRTIYTESDWGLTEFLLERYGITHVVVSPLERNWYGKIARNKFELNMIKVFEMGENVIYQRR